MCAELHSSWRALFVLNGHFSWSFLSVRIDDVMAMQCVCANVCVFDREKKEKKEGMLTEENGFSFSADETPSALLTAAAQRCS